MATNRWGERVAGNNQRLALYSHAPTLVRRQYFDEIILPQLSGNQEELGQAWNLFNADIDQLDAQHLDPAVNAAVQQRLRQAPVPADQAPDFDTYLKAATAPGGAYTPEDYTDNPSVRGLIRAQYLDAYKVRDLPFGFDSNQKAGEFRSRINEADTKAGRINLTAPENSRSALPALTTSNLAQAQSDGSILSRITAEAAQTTDSGPDGLFARFGEYISEAPMWGAGAMQRGAKRISKAPLSAAEKQQVGLREITETALAEQLSSNGVAPDVIRRTLASPSGKDAVRATMQAAAERGAKLAKEGDLPWYQMMTDMSNGMHRAAWGTLGNYQMFMETIGAKDRDSAEKMYQAAQDNMAGVPAPLKRGFWGESFVSVAEMAPQLTLATAAGVATGGLGAVPAFLAGTSTFAVDEIGQMYRHSTRDLGLPDDMETRLRAIAFGSAYAAVEQAQLKLFKGATLEKSFLSQAARKAIEKTALAGSRGIRIGSNLTMNTATEVVEEASQQIVEEIHNALASSDAGKKTNWAEARANVKEAVRKSVGPSLILSVGMGGAGHLQLVNQLKDNDAQGERLWNDLKEQSAAGNADAATRTKEMLDLHIARSNKLRGDLGLYELPDKEAPPISGTVPPPAAQTAPTPNAAPQEATDALSISDVPVGVGGFVVSPQGERFQVTQLVPSEDVMGIGTVVAKNQAGDEVAFTPDQLAAEKYTAEPAAAAPAPTAPKAEPSKPQAPDDGPVKIGAGEAGVGNRLGKRGGKPSERLTITGTYVEGDRQWVFTVDKAGNAASHNAADLKGYSIFPPVRPPKPALPVDNRPVDPAAIKVPPAEALTAQQQPQGGQRLLPAGTQIAPPRQALVENQPVAYKDRIYRGSKVFEVRAFEYGDRYSPTDPRRAGDVTGVWIRNSKGEYALVPPDQLGDFTRSVNRDNVGLDATGEKYSALKWSKKIPSTVRPEPQFDPNLPAGARTGERSGTTRQDRENARRPLGPLPMTPAALPPDPNAPAPATMDREQREQINLRKGNPWIGDTQVKLREVFYRDGKPYRVFRLLEGTDGKVVAVQFEGITNPVPVAQLKQFTAPAVARPVAKTRPPQPQAPAPAPKPQPAPAPEKPKAPEPQRPAAPAKPAPAPVPAQPAEEKPVAPAPKAPPAPAPEPEAPAPAAQPAGAERLSTEATRELVSGLTVQPKVFQGRALGYAEGTARSVAKAFVEAFNGGNTFELSGHPLQYWVDPETGQKIVIVGHSRFEGLRRGIKDTGAKGVRVAAVEFKGTRQEAIDYAGIENALGTTESTAERSMTYRKMRQDGDFETTIEESAQATEKKNAEDVVAMSFLAELGRALDEALRFGYASGESRKRAETIAVWIGTARKENKRKFTDDHEAEMYDWLQGNYGKDGARNHSDFKATVKRVLDKREEKQSKPEDPLNIDANLVRSPIEVEFDNTTRRLKEAVKDLEQRRASLDQMWAKEVKSDKGENPETVRLQKQNILDIMRAKEALDEHLGREMKIKVAAESQGGLFDTPASNEVVKEKQQARTDTVKAAQDALATKTAEEAMPELVELAKALFADGYTDQKNFIRVMKVRLGEDLYEKKVRGKATQAFIAAGGKAGFLKPKAERPVVEAPAPAPQADALGAAKRRSADADNELRLAEANYDKQRKKFDKPGSAMVPPPIRAEVMQKAEKRLADAREEVSAALSAWRELEQAPQPTAPAEATVPAYSSTWGEGEGRTENEWRRDNALAKIDETKKKVAEREDMLSKWRSGPDDSEQRKSKHQWYIDGLGRMKQTLARHEQELAEAEKGIRKERGEVEPAEAAKSALSAGTYETAKPALVELGRQVVADGHDTMPKFTKEIKRLLGDTYAKLKGKLGDLWAAVKEDRGSFKMTNPNTVNQREERGIVRRFARRGFLLGGGMPGWMVDLDFIRRGLIRSYEGQLNRKAAALLDAVRGEYANVNDKALLLDINAVLGGGQPVTALRAKTAQATTEMRATIDDFSAALKASGMLTPEMEAIIDSKMGVYLTRSYRIFDDPKYKQAILNAITNKGKTTTDALRRVDGMIRHLNNIYSIPDHSGLMAMGWGKLLHLAHVRGVDIKGRTKAAIITDLDTMRAAQGAALDPKEVERMLLELVKPANKDEGAMAFAQGRIVGAKDLRSLMRKKVLDEALLDLLGEHKDPLVNFHRSGMRIAQMLANHKFLSAVRAQGLKNGTFYEEKQSAPDIYGKPGRFTAVFNAEMGKGATVSPLDGLHSTEEVIRAMQAAVTPIQAGPVMRVFWKANSLVKAGKILNVQTTVRNFIGNIPIALMQGHFKLWEMPRAMDIAAAAWRDSGRWAAEVDMLRRRGIIGDGANSGEMRDMLNDADIRMNGYALLYESMLDRAIHAGKGGVTEAMNFYQLMDDVWKVFGFYAEQKRLMSKVKGWTQDQIDDRAAYVVRNTYPTYSLQPAFIRALRRWPLTGTFLSFPFAIMRGVWMTGKIALEELQSTDPGLKQIGMERLAFAVMTPAAIGGAIAMNNAALGIDDDDDLAGRRLLPEYERRGMIWWQEKPGTDDNGRPRLKYLNLSYTVGTAPFMDPLMALMRGATEGEFLKGMQDAAIEVLDPYITEEILSGVLLDIARNKKGGTGGEVWNEAEVYNQRQIRNTALRIVAYAAGKLAPGAVAQGVELWRGYDKQVNIYGKKYDMGETTAAIVTGFRPADRDVTLALAFEMRSVQQRFQRATEMLTKEAGESGKVSDEKLFSKVVDMEVSRQYAWAECRALYLAGLQMGLTQSQAAAALKGSTMGEQMAADIRNNTYRPWIPGPQFLRTQENAVMASEGARAGKQELDRRERVIRQQVRQIWREWDQEILPADTRRLPPQF